MKPGALTDLPALAEEFDVQLNGITPDLVNPNSTSLKRYWWNCSQGHQWDAALRDRVGRSSKCPYCSGRKATAENNLAVKFPEVAALFDTTKNGCEAKDVTPTYNRKMYWVCANGHEFIKSVVAAVETKGTCRECNSLAFNFPELREFYHSNNSTGFESLSYGSNKKVQWVCREGHEYWQTVVHKTVDKRGCPYCAGRYATPEENLLLAYPEVAKEFDAERNGITADQIRPKSNKKMWWKCSNGHSYQTTANKKTREDLPYGCPFCSGYQVDETNSLGHLYPDLAKEFLTEINGVDPYDIPKGRSKRYSWKCSKSGHLFQASVSARTGRGTGCPYCYGRYPTAENNLAVIKPEDAKHFHPTKNGTLTPYDFTPSSNKKVHWICENSHEWVAPPRAKKGCAQCSMSATSKIERLLRDTLIRSGIMESVEDEGVRLSIKWRKNSTLTVDILSQLGDRKFAIEYDGYYYHSGIHSKNKEDDYLKDTLKTQALLDHGYYVVRIREINYNGTLDFLAIKDERLLQLHYRYSNTLQPDSFNEVTESIAEWVKILMDN